MIDVVLKRFETADETRQFPKGRFEIVRLVEMTISRATYEPGWKWYEDVGRELGQTRCGVGHVGIVLSGSAVAAFDDGQVIELAAGGLFSIPALLDDSRVVGNQPYVSIHFFGAEDYTR